MSPALDINIFIQALIINGIIAVLAYLAKAVSKSGILGGLIVGIPIYTFMGWQGFVILFSMFAIGTIATKWGYQKKKEMGLAERNEGQRGISNVLGKCLAGVIFAFLCFLFKKNDLRLFEPAFIASFAAGAFDTVSSELGQLYGTPGCTYTIIPFKKAKNGTEGAVSLEGTFAGCVAALIIYLSAIFLLLTVTRNDNDAIGKTSLFLLFFICTIGGAILSNLLESILGSVLESKKIINKFVSNFLNTLFGGIFTILILVVIALLLDV